MCDKPDIELSDFDPTTSTGLLNLGTGGMYEVQKPIGDWTKEKGEELEDWVTNADQQEAIEEALDEQAVQQQELTDLMRTQYEDFVSAIAPYREAGADFLPQLTEALSPEYREQFMQDYLQGSEYQQLQEQATNQLLQSAAATGSLGASGTQDRLARQTLQLGSQLGSNAYNQQLANLTQGANIGFQTFGPQLQAQGQFQSGAQNALSNLGNLQLQQAAMTGGGLNQYLPAINAMANIYGATG